MIWRQHIHKVVPAPGWFRIWKCWSLRRGKSGYLEYSFFPEVWISLKLRVDYLLCFLSLFFFHFTRHSAFIELGIYCFSRVVEDFELFLKSVIEKMIIRIPRCFCCVSCPEQPSVLENILYHLHYISFKGEGQNILPVSFSLM